MDFTLILIPYTLLQLGTEVNMCTSYTQADCNIPLRTLYLLLPTLALTLQHPWLEMSSWRKFHPGEFKKNNISMADMWQIVLP